MATILLTTTIGKSICKIQINLSWIGARPYVTYVTTNGTFLTIFATYKLSNDTNLSKSGLLLLKMSENVGAYFYFSLYFMSLFCSIFQNKTGQHKVSPIYGSPILCFNLKFPIDIFDIFTRYWSYVSSILCSSVI